jgi:prepilin-type N-terminal cleavage/methylation domain-containing protein
MRSGGGKQGNAGFTLIEILVALAVMGVATTLIISLYANSVSLGQLDRSRRAAYTVAEALLADVSLNPSAYTWPDANALASGELAQIGITNPDSAYLPATLPPLALAHTREKELYERFSTSAYARGSDAAPQLVEVTVVVTWTEKGSHKTASLSTAMPRPVTGGQS